MPKALAALNLLVDCKHRRLLVESDQVSGLQIQALVTTGDLHIRLCAFLLMAGF